jgi:hypothetical protein
VNYAPKLRIASKSGRILRNDLVIYWDRGLEVPLEVHIRVHLDQLANDLRLVTQLVEEDLPSFLVFDSVSVQNVVYNGICLA